MHYKIREAHRLAIDSGVDFDLFVRMRPDRDITAAVDIDWREVARRCAAENLILVDEPRAIQVNVGYAMGDQFAAGAREGMDVYAATFDFVESGGLFGVQPDHVPHQSVALSAFHHGVRAELAPNITFGAFRNASRIPDEEIEALLLADTASRPLDEDDRKLLQACSGRGRAELA
jgi:hypothetical protein